MKPRQARHPVKITTQMRSEDIASDACILNASWRGFLVHALTPPTRGSYIELKAQNHAIVGRVTWVNEHYFGVNTQDEVPGDLVPALRTSPIDARILPAAPSAAVLFDNSRSNARAMQFALIVVLSAAAASLAFATVERTLARPLATAEMALSRR